MLPRYTRGAKCVVVFDLDKVLADTDPYVIPAFADWYAHELRDHGMTAEIATSLIHHYRKHHGNSSKPMSEAFGKGHDWHLRCINEVHENLVGILSRELPADPRLVGQIEALNRAGHIPAVLTFSTRNYCHTALKKLGVFKLFRQEHILTKESADGATKRTDLPYRRLHEALPPAAHKRPRIMTEDDHLNLIPCAAMGFTTVAFPEGHRCGEGHIHARYETTVHDFLDDFLAGTFQPAYA